MPGDDISDRAGGPLARRRGLEVHDGVEPCEGRELACPFGRVGEQRDQSAGDPVRCRLGVLSVSRCQPPLLVAAAQLWVGKEKLEPLACSTCGQRAVTTLARV